MSTLNGAKVLQIGRMTILVKFPIRLTHLPLMTMESCLSSTQISKLASNTTILAILEMDMDITGMTRREMRVGAHF